MVGVATMTSSSLREILSPLEDKTADEIAEMLFEMDITGRRYQACRCPIAKYIAKTADHDQWALSVGADRIELWDTVEGFTTNLEVVHLDQDGSIHDFILKFDNGGYPDLMEV